MDKKIICFLVTICFSIFTQAQVNFNLGEEYRALDYYLDGIKNEQVYSYDYNGIRNVYIKGFITNIKDSVTWYKREIKIYKTGQKREFIWIGFNSNKTLAEIILYSDKVHMAEVLVTDKFVNRIYKRIAPEYFT